MTEDFGMSDSQELRRAGELGKEGLRHSEWQRQPRALEMLVRASEQRRKAVLHLVLTSWSGKKVPVAQEDEAASWPVGSLAWPGAGVLIAPHPARVLAGVCVCQGTCGQGRRGCASCGRASWLPLVPQGWHEVQQVRLWTERSWPFKRKCFLTNGMDNVLSTLCLRA